MRSWPRTMRGIEAVSTQHQNYPPIFTTRGRELVVYGFTVLGDVAVPYHPETKQQSIFVRGSVDGTKAAEGGSRKQSRFPMREGERKRRERKRG